MCVEIVGPRPRRGRFPALEVAELFAGESRTCFRPLR